MLLIYCFIGMFWAGLAGIYASHALDYFSPNLKNKSPKTLVQTSLAVVVAVVFAPFLFALSIEDWSKR